MRSQTIQRSNATVIDPSVDFFVIRDHMPDINFTAASQSLDDAKIEYFGKNTIEDLFINQDLNYKDYFFIFDHYLNFDNFEFNGYFYPNFLLKTAVDYQKFSPQHSVDFTKKTHSVNCVMNKMRPPRLLASCWFANNNVDQLLHTQSWTCTDDNKLNLLDEVLQIGGLIDWTHEFGPKVSMLDYRWIDYKGHGPLTYRKNSSDEENFFDSEVNQLFKSTAISVVLEPVFWEHGSIATEKYMHAIYGGTIPLVSGYKIYDSLSTLGFDTFSDIIDTSSQYELDPILRVWNMLEKNKRLFLQWQELISDPQIQSRIINNFTLLQNPEQIFMNSLRLNSEQSLAKILSLKDCLKTYGFKYLDRLCITDKTNK
jgi:hypothetical protein